MAITHLKSRLKRLGQAVGRFPMASAWLVVTVIAVIGLATAPQVRHGLFVAPTTSSSGSPQVGLVAPSQLPPSGAVGRIKIALSMLDRVCSRQVLPPMTDRLRALRAPLHAVSRFVRHYPNARFRIQGESGTTQALMVVVESLLKDCAPTLVPLDP